MTQKSYSFEGVEWDSNVDLVDWQCSRCKARFSVKEDGIQHISAEHREGTLYPRLNTSGRLRLAKFLPAILGKTKNEILDILARDEPSVLESLGFRAEIVKESILHTQTVEDTMTETPNIPPKLYQDLQTALLRCGPFQNDSALRPLFVDSRISAWRDDLPSADSASKRVRAVIDYLLPKFSASGENALVLLILVLRDQVSRGDACCGQLETLVSELRIAIKITTPIEASQVGKITQAPSPKVVSSANKRALVKALVDCPSVSNRNTRDIIVNDLPDEIKCNIQRNNVDRFDVSSILTTCINYADGIQELIETIRFYESNSVPMQALDTLWRTLQ